MAFTVLQILPALEVGGVERGTLEVAAELVKRGHRSLVMSAGGRLVEQLENNGSKHIQLPIGKKSPATLLLVNKLKNILITEGVSIVHVRSRMPAWVTYLAWRGMHESSRPGFVTTVHGPYSVNAYSAVMTRGETIIAISNYIKDYIIHAYPKTDVGKIEMIYRGIDHELYPYDFTPDVEWSNRWHTEHPEFKNKFTVTIPSRITRWKGHEDFIQIIERLVKQELPVHGIIAGGYEKNREGYHDQLKKQIAHHKLENHITFVGHRNDLKEILSISNVVMSLAKEPEAFGRAALEALSLGTPVVAYDHGGAAEVLQNIFPAGKVPVHDTAAAVNRIKDFYNNPPQVARTDLFSLQEMLDKTLAVYQSLVDKKPGIKT